jgi:hypothetical protein
MIKRRKSIEQASASAARRKALAALEAEANALFRSKQKAKVTQMGMSAPMPPPSSQMMGASTNRLKTTRRKKTSKRRPEGTASGIAASQLSSVPSSAPIPNPVNPQPGTSQPSASFKSGDYNEQINHEPTAMKKTGAASTAASKERRTKKASMKKKEAIRQPPPPNAFDMEDVLDDNSLVDIAVKNWVDSKSIVDLLATLPEVRLVCTTLICLKTSPLLYFGRSFLTCLPIR